MNPLSRLALLAILLPMAAMAGTPVANPLASAAGSRALLPAAAVAATPLARTEDRAPCRDYTALRRPFFGDTHVHTAWSFDAAAQGTRNKPADAYAFAKGGAMAIQPDTEGGGGGRVVQLDRPLDFTAVTDHSEFFGELLLCETEGSPAYWHPVCVVYRNIPSLGQLGFGGVGLNMKQRWGFCGADDQTCLSAAGDSWKQIQQAAEDAYDRSADCQFTSFIGYEWTGTVGRGRNLHHNVIFRNERVPQRPKSWIDSPSQVQLWDYLEQDCVAAIPGCDAIAIPHNANLSGGLLFESARVESREIPEEPVTAQEATRRAHWNPLVEVMQHKGSSECDNRQAVWAGDEFCSFETLPYDTFGTKNTGEDGSGLLYVLKKLFGGPEFANVKPAGESSFVRYALKKGLQQQQELGVNSLKFGMIGSTDTHIAASGAVMEQNFAGHGGVAMDDSDGVPVRLPDELEFNPGGLAVLYAEENSRDALFAAMRRREAYATSGTRPVLRFFGGWDYPTDLCHSPDLMADGYAGGVPMGGDLPEQPRPGARPRFVVSALADAGTTQYPGNALQRLQLIKGWYADGELQEAVVDIAGGENGAAVDTNTCQQSGSGHAQLCTVWEDAGFSPGDQAFYYVRVLENPSCRWSQRLCVNAGVSCDDPASLPEELQACCAAQQPKTVQERAWSSPIWYTP